MTNSDFIISSFENNVLTLTLNRPELHNAFNEEMIALLTEKLKAADSNPAVRIVVLAARGKSFCAGADLNWMRKMAAYSYEENIADAQALATLMSTLYNLSKPTIAQVQGAAYGGGVGLVTCCDIAIAVDTATFCFSEVKLGLVPAVISPYIIDAIGLRAAQRYFLTAETFNAEEAYKLGLLHIVTSADLLQATSQNLAETLLKNKPQALGVTKKLMHKCNEKNINEKIIAATIECIAAVRVSQEGQAGLNAFLEKKR